MSDVNRRQFLAGVGATAAAVGASAIIPDAVQAATAEPSGEA
ncbi:twin-arginine translocation signal domain-containing protein, partial [Enterococcus lactis]